MSKYKDSIIFYFIMIVFFVVYVKLIGYVFNRWIPLSPTADLFTIIIIGLVVIPVSAISAHHLIKLIQK